VAERLYSDLENSGATEFSPEVLLKYEALGRSLSSCGSESAGIFDRFLEIGTAHPECASLLEACRVCPVDTQRFAPSPFEKAEAKYYSELRDNVEKNAAELERGKLLGLQGTLAQLYWGFFTGGSGRFRRHQLVHAVGEQLANVIEGGFVAIVEKKPAVTTLEEIAKLNASSQLYSYWYALLAGLDLMWERDRSITALDDHILRIASALALLLETFDAAGEVLSGVSRPWWHEIARTRADIVRNVVTALLKEAIASQRDIGPILYKVSEIKKRTMEKRVGHTTAARLRHSAASVSRNASQNSLRVDAGPGATAIVSGGKGLGKLVDRQNVDRYRICA
jgi:hypothetical protein